MPITAVVLDIGGVLEINDDALFPGPWCERHGFERERLDAAFAFPRDPAIGEMTELEIREHLSRELGLSDEQLDDLEADMWRWYVGELDRELYDWFAGLRDRDLKAGILSNSGPGAREQEACWGFEALVDVLVYSHEVGLKKPDPAIYALTTELLGVPSDETVFLDNWLPAVEGARAAGWHAVHHIDTSTSIRDIEALLAR